MYELFTQSWANVILHVVDKMFRTFGISSCSVSKYFNEKLKFNICKPYKAIVYSGNITIAAIMSTCSEFV